MAVSALLTSGLAVPASAQPAEPDRLGLYAVVGSAAPAQSLFRGAADPVLTLGYRLSDAVDVQLGARLGTNRVQIGGDQDGIRREVPSPVLADIESRTRALAASVGLAVPAGTARVHVRTSLAVDALARSTYRYGQGTNPSDVIYLDGGPPPEETSATFVHAGVSGTVALPIRRRGGQLAPGVGLAIATAERVGGSISAPPAFGMGFVSLPVSVEAGRVRLTLDARAGLARALWEGTDVSGWSPRTALSARVEI